MKAFQTFGGLPYPLHFNCIKVLKEEISMLEVKDFRWARSSKDFWNTDFPYDSFSVVDLDNFILSIIESCAKHFKVPYEEFKIVFFEKNTVFFSIKNEIDFSYFNTTIPKSSRLFTFLKRKLYLPHTYIKY